MLKNKEVEPVQAVQMDIHRSNTYRKDLQVVSATINRCLLILDLKPFRLYVKGKHSIGREFQSSCARKETVDIEIDPYNI